MRKQVYTRELWYKTPVGLHHNNNNSNIRLCDAKYPLQLTHHHKIIVPSFRRLFVMNLVSRKQRHFILTKHCNALLLNNMQATHFTPLSVCLSICLSVCLSVCPYGRNVPNIATNWQTFLRFTLDFLDDSVRLVQFKPHSYTTHTSGLCSRFQDGADKPPL